MARQAQRHPELRRWYTVLALGVLTFLGFRVYKLLSPAVESGLDASSRWSLLAVGLLNATIMATLLFIVARNLAKVAFERRNGILGGRIRTRLVLAMLTVGVIPSLLLYAIGRDFINKNVQRWFMPETAQVIQDGRLAGEALRAQVQARLRAAERRLTASSGLDALRLETGLDLLGRGALPPALAPGLEAPLDLSAQGPIETLSGTWLLHHLPGREAWVLGILVPRDQAEALGRLDKRMRDADQMRSGRETLQTLPQNFFLLLTLLSIFAAVWTGLTLSKAISEPVQELADAAARVGAGNLDTQLPEGGKDELAFLSRSFNRMTRDLKASRAAIESQSERIERQRAYLGQLLEALPVGVLSWQADGELRTFNPLARRWFEMEDPTLETDWTRLAQQPRFAGLAALLAQVRRSRTSRLEEMRIGSEGEGRPVRAMVVPLAGGGELALLEDLTQLAQAEKRAAWQEVARRMAHEVKNPLTPIKLTAQRLRRRAQEGRLEPQMVSEGAETILAEVTSLQSLVDSFSQFARLPAPAFRDLEVCDLVRQVAALYVPNHPALVWDILLPEGPVWALWDADMARRALINLVDNALGAGAHHIRICLEAEGPQVHLSVEDDGPGVPPEVRERLFQPYFSTKKKGSGLGLAIVRRIAQDHGGEASYTPLDRGSRFELQVPTRI